MRKTTILFLIIMISLVLLGNSKSSNDGVLLKYFSSNSLLKQILQLDANDPMNNIILLPEEEFNQEEAAAIIGRVQLLPGELLTKINEENIKLKLFVGRLTDNPTADHLSGVIPKGYKSEKTWDDVPGIGGEKIVLVKIGASDKGMGHGSVNLELHELAHSIDRYVFHDLRFNPYFLDIWREEKFLLFPDQDYYLTYSEEYFAETFAMFYVNDNWRTYLSQSAPKTYEFIKNLK